MQSNEAHPTQPPPQMPLLNERRRGKNTRAKRTPARSEHHPKTNAIAWTPPRSLTVLLIDTTNISTGLPRHNECDRSQIHTNYCERTRPTCYRCARPAYPTSNASQPGKLPDETTTTGGLAAVTKDCADTHDNHIKYAYRAMPTSCIWIRTRALRVSKKMWAIGSSRESRVGDHHHHVCRCD